MSEVLKEIWVYPSRCISGNVELCRHHMMSEEEVFGFIPYVNKDIHVSTVQELQDKLAVAVEALEFYRDRLGEDIHDDIRGVETSFCGMMEKLTFGKRADEALAQINGGRDDQNTTKND